MSESTFVALFARACFPVFANCRCSPLLLTMCEGACVAFFAEACLPVSATCHLITWTFVSHFWVCCCCCCWGFRSHFWFFCCLFIELPKLQICYGSFHSSPQDSGYLSSHFLVAQFLGFPGCLTYVLGILFTSAKFVKFFTT